MSGKIWGFSKNPTSRTSISASEQTSLRGDGQPHLLRHLQTIATNELDLLQEQADLAFELAPQLNWKSASQRDLTVMGWEILG